MAGITIIPEYAQFGGFLWESKYLDTSSNFFSTGKERQGAEDVKLVPTY